MPVDMTLQLQGADKVLAMFAEARGQLPFAQSKALNTIMNRAQSDLRDKLGGRFTLRRADFIKRTVYRRPGTYPQGDFASKASLTAALRINPERDVLVKHEDGGRKVARDGRLAIPLIRLDTNPKMVIGQGSRYNLKAMPVIPGAAAMSITRPKRGKGSTFYAIQTRKAGSTVIWESKGARTPPRAIWLLTKQGVQLPPRLDFTGTVTHTIERGWREVFVSAIEQALATAR